MGGLLLLALVCVSAQAKAPAPAVVRVQFATSAGWLYNSRGQSTLTVTGAGAALPTVYPLTAGGSRDPADPALRGRLLPVTVEVGGPFGGASRVLTLRATLFLCDHLRGVCTVREQQHRVTVRAGQPSTVTFPAPKDSP
ncbi:hypothetical protein E7T06_15190 [Deinococcus sp. Arct2-2]|uniref:hypothetical protein n=1 Tax=Deinococcus sp. Arct2-2 TaxID=2568653 RepID=UPI0010A4CC2C|nr:hypothetical protein [Deinococcus sp. Arct2-2]THF68711.1 hypothetical protein E7T06_15190 [Deinococcus sp. Arct2-2]